MTQYTSSNGVEASQMMWDAGQGGGSTCVNCQCGKDHSLPPDLTEEEYDAFESFGYIELDGKTFVYGCEGCAKKLLKYENLFWQSRQHIRQYLKIRVNQEKAWADRDQLLNTLAGIE